MSSVYERKIWATSMTVASNKLTPPVLLFTIFCSVSSLMMVLFAYNSGYGYDQLEYLVIGRALTEGIPFYTYFPSKSPGIFHFVGALFKMGVDFDHVSLSIVIATIYLGIVTCTFLVARRWFDPWIALTSAVLTGSAAFFMELNFLQPTSFVYVFGLFAFDALLRFREMQQLRSLAMSGLWIGLGVVFKSSAAFYGIACVLYLLIDFARNPISILDSLKRLSALAAGFLLPIVTLGIFYLLGGNLPEFIQWTFIFPLLEYPSSYTFFPKLYTKLLWVHFIVFGCVPLLFFQSTRRSVSANQPALLSMLFGVCAYLALFKTQASHYAFLGAPFLFNFAASVYFATLYGTKFAEQRLSFFAAGLGAATLIGSVSVYLYRPDVWQRAWMFRDYTKAEDNIRQFIHCAVRPQELVLITSPGKTTWTYWITHRYPPPPFINVDAKTIWILRNRPSVVYAVLENPNLVLVEFDLNQLRQPQLEGIFGDLPQDLDRIAGFANLLQQRFRPLSKQLGAETFWIRNELGERDCLTAGS